MPKQVWDVFLKKLQEKCLDMLGKAGVSPFLIDFTGFHKNVSLIIPADKESQATAVKMVSEIKADGECFEAWCQGEEGEYTCLTIYIPESLKASVLPLDRL